MQCVYCGLSNHLPHNSLKVTNKQERKTVSKTKNLCYICLEPRHVAKFCSSGYVCKRCNKKHHVSICNYNPRSPLNSQPKLTKTHQNWTIFPVIKITFCCKLHLSKFQIYDWKTNISSTPYLTVAANALRSVGIYEINWN